MVKRKVSKSITLPPRIATSYCFPLVISYETRCYFKLQDSCCVGIDRYMTNICVLKYFAFTNQNHSVCIKKFEMPCFEGSRPRFDGPTAKVEICRRWIGKKLLPLNKRKALKINATTYLP